MPYVGKSGLAPHLLSGAALSRFSRDREAMPDSNFFLTTRQQTKYRRGRRLGSRKIIFAALIIMSFVLVLRFPAPTFGNEAKSALLC